MGVKLDRSHLWRNECWRWIVYTSFYIQ